MTLKFNNDLLAFIAGFIMAYWLLSVRRPTPPRKLQTQTPPKTQDDPYLVIERSA